MTLRYRAQKHLKIRQFERGTKERESVSGGGLVVDTLRWWGVRLWTLDLPLPRRQFLHCDLSTVSGTHYSLKSMRQPSVYACSNVTKVIV